MPKNVMCVREQSFITRGGIRIWRGLEKEVLIFFWFENGVLMFFCSLKFTNFLKYVIFYVKLKFMVLAHSEEILKLFL